MAYSLNQHFRKRDLIFYTLPSILMMIFTSIYGVVDGFFVSNFVGEVAFTAVNFIYPYIMILGSIGFMFGSGGSALVTKYMGEQKEKLAKETFSMIVFISFISGLILLILGLITIEPVAYLLGARDVLLDNCKIYGSIIICGIPFFVLQMEFQNFFVSANKPKLGLMVTLISGISNMLLDYLLIALFKLGIIGAALATILSQVIGGIIPVIYFFLNNDSNLKFTKFKMRIKDLIKTCINGSSELMSQISMSLVGMLYNYQLLKYAGEQGVSSYGVLMYVGFIFFAIFIGYGIGSSPIVSYHFGADNKLELKSLLKKGLFIIGICSVSMFILAELLAFPLSYIFVGYNQELLEMTTNAFIYYSISFLFAGLAIFLSNFFTALNDGVTSAIISFLRTLVFQVACVIILPLIFNLNGIWISIVIAELLALIVSIICLITKNKKYNYY